MMKIGFNFGLKIWLNAALLFFGFVAVESACATDRFSVTPGFNPVQTVHTELADITAGNTRNQSVRLVLFGFAIGVSAILIYVVVFKSAAKASIAKWFYKIFRIIAPRDRGCPDLRPPLFLHDKTRDINHTVASPAPRVTPPLEKTDKLTETEEKTPLDDDKK